MPWREPGCSPWLILVSEIMLQQTPVNRVLPIWREWAERWPTPADLADASPADVIRAWGRLGYPRRALRLHQAAQAIVERHNGSVPSDHAELLALPGIGSYTAAAVASFAFGQRHAVLDTNVRRVFARTVSGVEYPPPALTAAETRLATELLPEQKAHVWAVAVMELGALICTARSPKCAACPVSAQCAWRLAGSPPHTGPARKGQAWAGTDRQIRGALMAALRHSKEPLSQPQLVIEVPDSALRDPGQRSRCLAGLIEDGLVEPLPDERYQLPA
ncbi:A/G-specific adenine glycosylase [Kineosporia rhizophila]|uniref:A/G-specific adenine glycosylase n=1 Tax=Kineosporia rhizophila TaxID=84633 RepID=UPI001E526F4C|nr:MULTISPECIES: A/G-specific adenine glycosylase [Kineosporia]MCE0540120.1 A/G-specific adenine glycosylase [Kineosporia rhizophila]GLY13328.1 adenine glycosylase [Kineosporia sp. NBRC 101677]